MSRACRYLRVVVALLVLAVVASPSFAQGLGGAGTVQGTVKDPTGGVMQAVQVRISNAVSGFSRSVTTDGTGRYVFSNLPPNPYHITVEAQGFQTLERDVDVRTGVPITVDLTLALAGATTAVEVVGHAGNDLHRLHGVLRDLVRIEPALLVGDRLVVDRKLCLRVVADRVEEAVRIRDHAG